MNVPHTKKPRIKRNILSSSRVLLRLIPCGLGEGDVLNWLFEGTPKRIELLDFEVDQYNEWITNTLVQGLASLASYNKKYVDDYVLNSLLTTNDKRYEQYFGKAASQFYDMGGDGWEFVYIDEKEKNYLNTEYVQSILDEYSSGDIVIEDYSTLIDIIEKPWEIGAEFSMGYRVLPMTKMLIERANIK